MSPRFYNPSLGMLFGTTASAPAWIQVTTCDKATETLHLLYHNGVKIRNNYFPGLSVCIYHHLWHPVGTNLGTTKLSNNYHYNIFLMDREEQNSPFAVTVAVCRFITSAYAVRHYFTETATTKQFVECSAHPFPFSA
jgi:hypothetical protein